MGIGGSIFLIVVGAIIAFGVNNQSFGPFDLNVVGWILMLAGFVGLALTLWVWNSRRARTVAPPPPPAAGGVVGPTDQVVEERYTERRNYP
jgi:hypothetical protein